MKRFARILVMIIVFAWPQIAHSQYLPEEKKSLQCLAVKFEMESMTPKTLHVLYCYMNFAQSGLDSAEKVIKCIEENGIQLSDPDIAEVIRVLPEEECIDDIIEKKDALDSGEDYALQTDLAADKLAGLNISDSVLCVAIYSETEEPDVPRLLHKDVCFTSNTDPRIVSFSRKQALGEQLTEVDKTNLIHVYFELCSTLYQSKFEEQKVRVETQLVTFPGECQSTDTFKSTENEITKYKHFRCYFKIAVYILASIGLLGNLVSLSVCCRPSFIADQHISYYVIARCLYDTDMLIYCILRTSLDEKDLIVSVPTNAKSFEVHETVHTKIQCISVFCVFHDI